MKKYSNHRGRTHTREKPSSTVKKPSVGFGRCVPRQAGCFVWPCNNTVHTSHSLGNLSNKPNGVCWRPVLSNHSNKRCTLATTPQTATVSLWPGVVLQASPDFEEVWVCLFRLQERWQKTTVCHTTY